MKDTEGGQRQFALLVLINLFVGGMVGVERSILPLVAEADFGIASATAATAFIATFGLAKAALNVLAGTLADRWGRRRILIGGWLLGLPVPFTIMFAASWSWILFANVLLGVQQALAWSMTLNMKIDRVDSGRRGWATGWNESAGYTGVALAAYLSGLLASEVGMRQAMFLSGLALALAGTVLSFLVAETRAGSRRSARSIPTGTPENHEAHVWSSRTVFVASACGLVMNLKDGALWGLMPLFLAAKGLGVPAIALVAGVYPAVWGVSQLLFGFLSDRTSRTRLVILGLGSQAAGVTGLILAGTVAECVGASLVVGLGTAMTYPTLMAAVADVSPEHRRASTLGVYRFWRDSGYVVGALGIGLLADSLGFAPASFMVAGLLIAAAAGYGMVRRTAVRHQITLTTAAARR